MNRKGLFITVEGIEGAGKSTAMQFLCEQIKKYGQEVVVTREPGGTEIAEKIRQILLNHHEEKMSEDAELLLMFACRAQHMAQVILPAVQSGKVVLCDRFTDASFAYQGGGRGIDENRIAVLERWVQGDLQPDITILLDLPVEVGLGRAKNRGELDRFETEKVNFFERVRQCYLDRAKRYPHRFRVVDASVSLDQIQKNLSQLVEKLFRSEEVDG